MKNKCVTHPVRVLLLLLLLPLLLRDGDVREVLLAKDHKLDLKKKYLKFEKNNLLIFWGNVNVLIHLVSRLLDDGDCVVDVPGGLAVVGHDLNSKIYLFIYLF